MMVLLVIASYYSIPYTIKCSVFCMVRVYISLISVNSPVLYFEYDEHYMFAPDKNKLMP